MTKDTQPLLEVDGLRKTFYVRGGLLSSRKTVPAVQGVSFSVFPSDCYGIIGESGSGKTTVGNLITRLEGLDQGYIRFQGRDLHSLSSKDMRGVRKDLQIVFQQSRESLDRKRTIGQLLMDPISMYRGLKGQEARTEVARILGLVGLQEKDQFKLPTELSGGQKQRVCIARAISTQPKLVLLDEPTSALDISVQGQVLNLLKDLQSSLGLTYILITHDLKVVRHMCNRLAVMQAGQIVEQGAVDQVFGKPQNAYTKQLLASAQLVRD